eukprot:NODE_29012_length_459_cov_1.268072.p3 GENE.NODE_29012_length_459_cov_1.268072~~NODE_29012_length_459_cov_1.268072.p3  ORF type:complete len:78 (-),score=3.69 NODE_29012_length_459_cov_1.268072:2-235(-)
MKSAMTAGAPAPCARTTRQRKHLKVWPLHDACLYSGTAYAQAISNQQSATSHQRPANISHQPSDSSHQSPAIPCTLR